MSDPRYWWERIPGLLNYELDELARVAARVELDEAARRRGQIRIAFTYQVDGRDIDLVAIYPDSYPYFRPELFAHGERLEHHQHPFRKNLCLMGRPTPNWYTEETLASFLQDQLATVFQTGRAKSREAVAGREEEQAEPFSEYYSYQPCSVLVDGSWNIDPRYRSGGLALATRTNSPVGVPLLQAALMEVKDNRGRPLQRAPWQWRRAFSGPLLYGRWVRVDQPIRENDPDKLVNAAVGQPVPPGPEQRVGGWRLRVLGVLFPEETSHRRSGYGWVFACRAEGFGGTLGPRDKRRAKRDRAGGAA